MVISAQVVGGCVVVWCLDSPCGVGVSTSAWFGIYPFVLRSQYQWGAFLLFDLCVDVVRWLSLWGENPTKSRIHPPNKPLKQTQDYKILLLR